MPYKLLGLKYGPDGRLYVCDADGGLKARGHDGTWETLSSGRFVFADDLDFAPDGTIWFTEASTRHPPHEFVKDLLEHQTTGRVLRYDPGTGSTSVLAAGLHFANGIAFGADRSWAAVAETGNYRLLKVRADGGVEPFVTLPGFPDNVTWSPERGVFWVTLGSPRDAIGDATAPFPLARKVILRLPTAVQPKAKKHTLVLGYDGEGRLKENLQWKDERTFSPAASAVEHEGWLYLGSFTEPGIARLRLP